MIDIDGDVVETCKKMFPTIACAYDDPRVNLIIGDGLKFVREYDVEKLGGFDVIVVDSSDPVGPAEGLFSADFYAAAEKILNPDGVIGAEGETFWIGTKMILDMMGSHFKPYALGQYCAFGIPTYPCGDCGIFLGRKEGKLGKFTMSEPILDSKIEGLRYYTPDMHRSAFALPAQLRNKLDALAVDCKELQTESLWGKNAFTATGA